MHTAFDNGLFGVSVFHIKTQKQPRSFLSTGFQPVAGMLLSLASSILSDSHPMSKKYIKEDSFTQATEVGNIVAL